jgi:hypothetical protein
MEETGKMAQPIIPATWEAEINQEDWEKSGRLKFKASLGKKLTRPHLNK